LPLPQRLWTPSNDRSQAVSTIVSSPPDEQPPSLCSVRICDVLNIGE